MLYWAIPSRFNRVRNLFLLVVSYLLYMNWKPSSALILFGVTLICYVGGYFVDNQKDKNRKKAKGGYLTIRGGK